MEISRLNNGEDIDKLRKDFKKLPGKLLSYQGDSEEIHLKQNTACLILKTGEPCYAFLLKEPRMVAAIEFYLQNR